MITLNENVKFILETLNKNGYEAYVVGGAIRNLLLGITPLDYDLTTNATPSEIMDVFSFTKTILTGAKYGTVTVIYNNEKYEITTYRIDGIYENNRHPKEVVYTSSLEDDLRRRDFTVNAFAYNDELIDFHNGINDLNNKLIRCIGDPNSRFNEDALRILRAIRFSVKLGFFIEENTKKAIHKNAKLLKNIPIERINNELFEIFKYINEKTILEYFDVLSIIFPHLKKSSLDKIICTARNCNNPLLLYCSFFENINEDQKINIINMYRLSNYEKHIICLLTKHDIDIDTDVVGFKKILKNNRKNDIILYVKYHIYDIKKQASLIEKLEYAFSECHSLKQLQIKGHDLKKLGFVEKDYSKILNYLLDLVIENKLKNNKDDLISYLKSI